MKIRIFAMIATVVLILTACLPGQTRANGLVEGKIWFFDAMANSPGICVTKVDRYVVDYRVECTQPGWKTVIWQGLPQPGDYIDTLGANWVKLQAFYSFPSGVKDLVGVGVHVKHAEYPPDWSHIERTRKTNTIRVQNPDWDFTFRNSGISFAPCIRRALQSNYQVTESWGGPRFDRGSGGCEAVEGDWDWFNGGRVHLHADGVAKGTDALGKASGDGKWKCVDPKAVIIEVIWVRGGWRDTLRLSADGKRLEGQNQLKTKVWAVRAAVWDFADCQAVVGTWTWFDGGTVVLDGRGGVQGYNKGSVQPTNPGSWRCVNGSPVTILITWVKGGWVDTLTLTAGNRRLEGRNQQNKQVWAERK
jgi:hypothetical protein